MQLQDRDIQTLALFARYFMLTSRQVKDLAFDTDSTGRVTRRRLTKMCHAGFLRKRVLMVVSPRDGSAMPVYHLTKEGREFLASHFDDDTLLRKPIEPSQPQHLFHYIAVSDSHMLLERSLTPEKLVQMHRWVNEDEYVNPGEPDHKNQIKLLTHFAGEARKVCVPDAAMLIESQGHKAVVYLEIDRDTFFHDRVAARKTPGYQKLLAAKGHRRHFPDTTIDHFFVWFIAPSEKRADQLRRAFAKTNATDPMLRNYRFITRDELRSAEICTAPLFRCCFQDEPIPLVKHSVSTVGHANTVPAPLLRSGSE